uniref:Uncharacterized protein n=1 Tax=Cacopsylla melanoneura TaxID=428564 RepID=A0A8D8VTJ4_9HEMI
MLLTTSTYFQKKWRRFFNPKKINESNESLLRQSESVLHQKAFSVKGGLKFGFKPTRKISEFPIKNVIMPSVTKKLKGLLKNKLHGVGQVKRFFSYYGVKYFHADSNVKQKFTK